MKCVWNKMLILAMLSLSTSLYAQEWKPKAWLNYLYSIELKKDTLNRRNSIMSSNNAMEQKVDLTPFHCGPYYVPPPKPIFEDNSWRESSKKSTVAGFLADFLFEVLLGGLAS